MKTSVPKQLEFIRTRKNSYAGFTALVRLLKFWRIFMSWMTASGHSRSS